MMKCKNCNASIPESIGECVYCNSGIPSGIRGIPSGIRGIRGIPTKVEGGHNETN